jgi:LysM repeat protein
MFVWVIAVLSACKPDMQSPETTGVTGTLIPYSTKAGKVEPSFTHSPEGTLEIPSVTPTLNQYTVKKDELGWTIASRNSITLAQLQAANPGVDLNFLKEGQILVIPVPQSTPNPQQFTPTPIFLNLSTPICHHSGDDGAWCVSLVSNNTGIPVETVSGEIVVLAGGKVISEIGILPLDRLEAGQALPLLVRFPPKFPYPYTTDVRLISALPLTIEEDKYLPVSIPHPEVIYMIDDLAARVKGSFDLGTGLASYIRVVAIGWNDQQVVGYRIWEYRGGTAVTGSIGFDIMLYSIGPKINRVEVVAEARK